ncbi:MAG: hypothetical protein K2J82_09565 [Muribaculaceae bacterium]|nr:hypothetical protein [Muribaculaceae bacterium]MDE6754841.1 hypothetical protein [Muribaculaceae bacterium]
MKVIKMLSVLAVFLLMAACGSKDAQSVEQKIKDGAQLTEADYTEMIEYCGKFAEEAQKIQDKINALPADDSAQGTLTDQMAALSQKFPLTESFSEKITNATKEEMGEKNVELVNKYAPLMWFSAPDWAEVPNNVNVDGFIEDMPSTDSTGVIATGDGVAVDSTK